MNATPPGPQAKVGWLQKRGDKGLRTWAKRFFTLDANGLAYFVDETRTVQKGMIAFNEIMSVVESPANLLLGDWFASGGGYFQVNTGRRSSAGEPGRVFFLFAETKAEATTWIVSINYWKSYKPPETAPAASVQPPPPTIPQAADDRPDSRYYQFLQFQQQPLYQSPFEDPPVVNAIASTQSVANNVRVPVKVPPQPPRPLRSFTASHLYEFLSSEGDPLKYYVEVHKNYCDMLMKQNRSNQPRWSLLCLYLEISSLDWDNRNTRATPLLGSPSYESDPLFPYFAYVLSLVRQEILNTWPVDAPSVLTQIDIWIKRKRSDQQSFVQREDREALIKRNVVIVNSARTVFVDNNQLPQLDDAFGVLIDRLLEAYDQIPHMRYGSMLCEGLEAHVQQKDRLVTKFVLWGYLLLQKLKLENDHFRSITRDPHLDLLFDVCLRQYTLVVTNLPPLKALFREVQDRMMKIFAMWDRDVPLLTVFVQPHEPSVIYLNNLRIIVRLVARLETVRFDDSVIKSLTDIKWALLQKLGLPAEPAGYPAQKPQAQPQPQLQPQPQKYELLGNIYTGDFDSNAPSPPLGDFGELSRIVERLANK